MLEALKKQVCQANLNLVKEGLMLQTWGNVGLFPSVTCWNSMPNRVRWVQEYSTLYENHGMDQDS